MLLDTDTIVAVSTPAGRGGIGVVRLSGGEAVGIARRLCRTRSALAAGRVRFGYVLGGAGETLDEAVVTYFAGPHSYTAEDVVEIACHGSPVLLEHVVRMAIAGGARLAEPGEFTQRAFLSGRLDLTQAEAVNDLIAAQTLEQTRVAAAQLGGSLARALAPVKTGLIELIAALEAGIDFAEDDLDVMPGEEIAAHLAAVRRPVEALAASYAYGRTVREGFTLAIVGRPNAGKSSLFNRLLERDRSIVTATAGTTRDSITETFSLEGIPVQLIDTAGLRAEAADEAERLGMARTREAMAEADLVLQVIDATELEEGLGEVEGRAHLIVRNKIDLVEKRGEGEGIATSAVTGEGIDGLKAAMFEALALRPAGADSAMITNVRQFQALEEAGAALRRAGAEVVPHEFLLLDLHAALEALDGLTGSTSNEDILRVIFSRFCIGK